MSEVEAELIAAAKAHNFYRREVVEWVQSQRRLVTNEQAPSWQNYTAARDRLDKAIAETGE